MKPSEVERLIGGYATGTLTEAERSVLYAAALDNQALFEALADEEALRELLADPAARAALVGVLGATAPAQAAQWWRAWAAPAAALAVCALIAVGVGTLWNARPPKQEMAMNRPAPAAPPATYEAARKPAARKPEPEPEPQPREKKAEAAAPQGVVRDQSPAGVAPAMIAEAPPAAAPPPAQRATGPAVQELATQVQVPPPAAVETEALARNELAKGTVSQPVPADAARPAPPPITWRLLRGEAEVPAAQEFKAGETLRLRVRSARDGLVYLIAGEGNGGRPMAESRKVSAGEETEFAVSGRAGELRLKIVYSATQLAGARMSFATARKAARAAESFEGSSGGGVSPRAQADVPGPVSIDLTLRFR